MLNVGVGDGPLKAHHKGNGLLHPDDVDRAPEQSVRITLLLSVVTRDLTVLSATTIF